MRLKVLCCLVAVVLAVPLLFGCEASSLKLRKVSSDVILVLTHHGKPIAGIEVRILREGNAVPIFTGTSDGRGLVVPAHLRTGKYFVRASHEGFDAPTEWLEVTRQSKPDVARTVEINWADWSKETSRVAGSLVGLIPGNTGSKLMDLAHPVSTTYPGVGIELKHAFSGQEYKTLSDSSGAFIFPEVPEGTYILTIAGGMKWVGGIADATRLILDVRRNSAKSSLPLEIRDDGCGVAEFQLTEN